MINMNKLHNMTFEEGKIYLERNGYIQNDSANSTDTTISDRVEDIYFTLYDEDGQEVDVISYYMFYNQIGNREDEDIEIISEDWQTLEKVA
ncbi:hypothetical protein [Coprococcus sp. RTP21281st1_F1_RTP21281_210402]|uniref:hypothetical protein n=1 Tax=Coprococcus sp. RTP21281st1_F1_RTP21281_210402 TaxID=3143208 RepID=UPI0034A17944